MTHVSEQQLNSPVRRRTCGNTWLYRPSRIWRATWRVVVWGFLVCRKGTHGPARRPSIRHQEAARSSGREPISAASPPRGAETRHKEASSRWLSDCLHGTPAITQRRVWVRGFVILAQRVLGQLDGDVWGYQFSQEMP
jgi:hypothetical protein